MRVSIPKHKLILVLVIVVFHSALSLRGYFTALFPHKETGYIVLAALLLGLLAATFLAEKYTDSFHLRIPHQKPLDFKASLRLFLVFIPLICVLGILIRVVAIKTVPLLPIADMLPLIEKAAAALLAGQNPYQVYFFPYPMPLTFLPGLWLPYLPAVLFHFDPRWVGLLLWCAITAVLIAYTIQVAARKSSSAVLLFGGINILLLQISLDFVSFQAYGHTFAYWLWLVILAISLLEGKYILGAAALGLVLCSRQTAVVYLPIVAAFWFVRVGLRSTLKYFLVAGLVFGAFMLPFFIASPYQLIVAPLQHYQQLAASEVSLGADGKLSSTIGFAYFVQTHWGARILSLLSAASALVITALSYRMVKTRTRTMLFFAAAATFFSFFTPIPWIYLYYPPLLFLALAAVVQEQ